MTVGFANLILKLLSLTGLTNELYEKVFDLVVAFAESEIQLILGLEQELEKMNRTRVWIEALLTDAEDRRVIDDENVKLWLQHLKDVALDSEDLLDEVETWISLSKMPTADHTRKRKRSSGDLRGRLSSMVPVSYPLVLFRRRVAKDVVAISNRFDQIAVERKNLRVKKGDAAATVVVARGPVSTSPVPDKNNDVVVGRDSERDRIKKLLMGSAGGGGGGYRDLLPAVAIVGMGGMGKTALARYVYNDEEVERHFEVRVWIFIDRGSNAMKLARDVVEFIDKKKCKFTCFDPLQRAVLDRLSGKRFLLVLDNVGEEFAYYWEDMRAPMLRGAEGSRVLVTCRSTEASRRLRVTDTYQLPGLSDEDSLMLFLQKTGDISDDPNLKRIANNIVKKFQGSPLAAKSLGSLLCSRDDDEWRSVLGEMWELPVNANGILPTLKISYEHLPLHLKKCFAFCAIFPNDFEFGRDELVRMWVAAGVIKQQGRRRMESIADGYFDALLWRAFFQATDSDGGQAPREKYKMPSLIHDLAQSVSKHECFRVENDLPPKVPEKARYSFLFHRQTGPAAFDKFYGCKSLRAFILRGESRAFVNQVPRELFVKFKYMRVLDLGCSEITELPVSIGELKLLRYLGLYDTRIERLPDSVSSLYNLQTLELSECYRLLELPEETSNLVNLRHLSMHLSQYRVSDMMTSMPAGIGKLTSLQTLSRYVVGTTKGCGINELKDLDIQGELRISKLENVIEVDDAKVAKLAEKSSIHTLTLQWSDNSMHNTVCKVKEEIINFLCPYNRIKNLWIDNYDGFAFPKWMMAESFPCLTCLRLSYCRKWESFPMFKKLPNLKDLWLEGLHGVKIMFHGDSTLTTFPSLERLTLWDAPRLENWFIYKGEMPCLKELHISHCPKLKELPHLPPALEKLGIKYCRILSALPDLPAIRDLVIERCNNLMVYQVEKFTSLSTLTIFQIPLLSVMCKGNLQPRAALSTLKIEGCVKLKSLSEGNGLQDLVSLETLEIILCPNFEAFPEDGLPARLVNLKIHYCSSLKTLPSRMHTLGCLERLELNGLPNLGSLPELGVPSSLKYLVIRDCPLLSRRCQREDGEDWHKIENVHYVDVSPA